MAFLRTGNTRFIRLTMRSLSHTIRCRFPKTLTVHSGPAVRSSVCPWLPERWEHQLSGTQISEHRTLPMPGRDSLKGATWGSGSCLGAQGPVSGPFPVAQAACQASWNTPVAIPLAAPLDFLPHVCYTGRENCLLLDSVRRPGPTERWALERIRAVAEVEAAAPATGRSVDHLKTI